MQMQRQEAGGNAANAEARPSQPDTGMHRVRHDRRTPLWILAALAAVVAMYLARDLLIPIAVAIVAYLLIHPAMRPLERAGLPQTAAAAVVIVVLAGLLAAGTYYLTAPVSEWIERIPTIADQVQEKLRVVRRPVEQMQRASEQVEKATRVSAENGMAVTIRPPSLLERLVGGLQSTMVKAGIVLVILYFLLATGDTFKLKVVRVLPRLQEKKRAVAILGDVERQVSRFLVTQTAINAGLGVAIAVALWLIGVPNAALWGLIAAILNFVPFFGFVIGIGTVGTVALLSFEAITHVLAAPAAYAAIKMVEGNFLSPLILGHRLTLNPLVLILSLLFWGWLWGPAGAILAVPILVIVKTLCDHIEGMATLGEFIGD